MADHMRRSEIYNKAYEMIEYLGRAHKDFKHFNDATRDAENLDDKFNFIREFMRNDLDDMERLQFKSIPHGKRLSGQEFSKRE